MDLRLKIENQVIDTYDDETIILNRGLQDVKDITKLFSDFTQEFTIPGSPNNNKIFTYFYNLDVSGTFDQHSKASAVLEYRGLQLFVGNIELREAKIKNQQIESYTIVFYSNIKSLDLVAREDTLQDIDFSAYDEVLNYANVVGSWASNNDIIWPVFDSGRNWLWSNSFLTNPQNINSPTHGINQDDEPYGGIRLEELKPAIKLPSMINTIFEHYGYTLDSTWLADADRQNMYLHLNRIAGNIREEDEGINANCRALIDVGVGLTDSVIQQVTFDTIAYDIAGSLNFTTYEAQYTGSHRFQIEHNVIKVSPSAQDNYKIFFYKNGVQLPFPVITSFSFNNAVPQVSTVNLALSAGDQITFYVLANTGGCTLDAFAATKIGGSKTLFNQTVHIAKQMPNMKVTDFITGVLKTFNLVLEPLDESTFKLIPVDDWYSEGLIKVWDDYIDVTTEQIGKVPVYKNLDFMHQDSDDVATQAYKRVTGVDFARLLYQPDVDFGEKELKIETPFNVPVPQVLLETAQNGGSTQNTTNLHLHKYVDEKGKEIGGQMMLMYYNGRQSCTPYYLQSNVDANDDPLYTNSGFYPHFSIFSEYSPDKDSNTLAFTLEESLTSAIRPLNTLFQLYYNRYIGRIYSRDTKVLTCEAVLPVGEILNLRLNQKIVYNGQQFTINNFKYDFLKEKAFLELLTYDENIEVRTVSDIDPGTGEVTFSSPPTNRDIASYNLQKSTDGTQYYIQNYVNEVNVTSNSTITPEQSTEAESRVRHTGAYEEGREYYENEQAVQDGWTMIADKRTTDQPAPVLIGIPEFTIDNAIAWEANSHTDYVISGNRYTFTQGGFITAVRVYIPETDIVNTTFVVRYTNVTTGEEIFTPQFQGNAASSWQIVSITTALIEAGAVVQVDLIAFNSSTTTSWTWDWRFAGTDNNNNPNTGDWNSNTQNNILRIHDEDNGGTDRSTDLANVVPQTIIRIEDKGNANNFIEYEVDTSTDNGTYYTFDVIPRGLGGSITAGTLCTINATIPQPDTTDYVSKTNHWTTLNEPVFASVTGVLQLGNGIPTESANAYGTDIQFQQATASEDWEFVAYTDLAAATSSASSVEGIINITSNIAVSPTNDGAVIYMDPTGGNIIETLPNALLFDKKTFTFKRVINGNNYISLSPATGEKIDAIDDTSALVLGTAYDVVTLRSDAGRWNIVQDARTAVGVISLATPTTQAITTAWSPLTTWDTNQISTPGRITADQANDRITVDIIEGAVDIFAVDFNISFEYSNNIDLDFCLYVDGVSHNICVTEAGRGVRVIGSGFTGSVRLLSPQPKQVQVYVKADANGTLDVEYCSLSLNKL